ncbi:hypothetical protein AAHV54_10065 [Klebsiella variicola subsp. variicola]|uniref:hypothetical protein n=1 Tax=Klebsiella variicola TaxID=244366 RepID=UPI00359C1FBB
MTKSTITRERLEELAAGQSGFNLRIATYEESQELASIALAAMDSEPVAWTWHYREQWHVTNDERRAEFVAKDGDVAVLPLYRHAQPAPAAQCPYPCGWDTLNKLAIQDAAFVSLALVAGEPATESIRRAVISNNDRLLKVISFCRDVMPNAESVVTQKECQKCKGTGIADSGGVQPWGEPISIECDCAASQSIAVMDIDELRLAFEAKERESDEGFNLHKYGIGYADDATQARWEQWLACRAAMLQAQSDDDGEPTDDERIMAIEGIHNCERCGDEGWVVGEMGITRCACGQADNSPVIGIDPASGPDCSVEVRYVDPPGYVMVPKEPTEEMLAAAKEWTGLTSTAEVVYVKMLAAAPQEVK